MSTLSVGTVHNSSGASPTGVGKIIQTKIGYIASDLAGGSTSFTDTGLSQTITLASTSNKLLIHLSTTPYLGGTSGEEFQMKVIVTPSGGSDATVIHDRYWAYRTNDDWKSSSGFHQALYSPSSTAVLTVKLQYARNSGGDTIHLFSNSNDPSTNTLVLHEVAA
tara:strand:+ start:600 stop:1091 length:492 start_codon:yes stop_codon:yes gene_type:complete